MPASFPPELCDQIIDYLWDDLDTLRACSLTCHDWLPSSRFHLFRSIRLRHADDVSRFRALLISCPSVAHCVRKLAFSADYDGATSDDTPREGDTWVDGAVDLLPLLKNVVSLTLTRVKWHALSEETRAAFATMSTSVQQLFLFEVSFAASRDVIAFLSAFPALRDLYFQAVSWTHDSPSPFDDDLVAPEPEAADPGRMQLSYLVLDSKSSPTLVVEWLLRRPEEPRLQTIQLCWHDLTDTKPLGDLLRASGASLESLQVEFPSGSPIDPAHPESTDENGAGALTEHVNLAHNPSLRALHFVGLDARGTGGRAFVARRLFPWVSAMLAQVRSRRLQDVSFALEIATPADLHALDWARIGADLCRDEFRGLTVSFLVVCDEDGVAEDVKKEIWAQLAGFQERGTLSVSCI